MPKSSKWTGSEVQRRAATRMHCHGATVHAIAKHFSCRTDLISEVLRERGCKVRRGRERISPVRQEALFRRYREGATIQTLMEEFGMSRSGVSNLLARAGMKSDKWSRWTPERLQQLRKMVDEGWTPEEIGAELQLTKTALGPKLRQVGVPPMASRCREHHPHWKGGRVTSSGGYILVRPTPEELPYCQPNSSGYVLEHRLVMGRAVGRPLTADETVHHINGDPADNRLGNLQLRQGKHGSGVVMTCNACGSHDIRARHLS